MPRERLLEDPLTAQFSCKKHVIREALTELERMGLVERVLNKGATVRFLDPEAVRQIYIVREALETLAAEQIPFPVPASLLDELKRIRICTPQPLRQMTIAERFGPIRRSTSACLAHAGIPISWRSFAAPHRKCMAPVSLPPRVVIT